MHRELGRSFTKAGSCMKTRKAVVFPMLIIGELLNSTRKEVGIAITTRDARFIRDLAISQARAGADMIDVNTGALREGEEEALCWMVEVVQQAVELPLCLDSANPAAIEEALKICHRKPLINSISLEKNRYDSLLPLAIRYGTPVVALCMDDKGIPKTAEQRLNIARGLLGRLTNAGVNISDIYIDPLVYPVATEWEGGKEVLNAISRIKEEFKESHVVCGLSNISYGLPARKLLNRVFLTLAMGRGLDAVIMDPLDTDLMAELISAQALLGQDEFFSSYLKYYRQFRMTGGH